MSQRSAVMAVFFLRCIRWPLQVYCCGRRFRLWCWYLRRASGFRGLIGMSIIKIKDYGKTRMRGRKKILNAIRVCYMCMHVHIFIYLW